MPYLIISICYADILRTVRKSQMKMRQKLVRQVSEITANIDDNEKEETISSDAKQGLEIKICLMLKLCLR